MTFGSPRVKRSVTGGPTRRLAQSRTRHLTRLVLDWARQKGWIALDEMVLPSDLQADVIAMDLDRGVVSIYEIKRTLSDLRQDKKWQGYEEWSNALYFVVDASILDQTSEFLPEHVGVMTLDYLREKIGRESELRDMSDKAFGKIARERVAGSVGVLNLCSSVLKKGGRS